MTDIGVLAQRVNSQGYEVFIAISDAASNDDNTAADKYVFLQNASLSMSHSEFREPTTSGGLVYYSGLPDNTLSGTLLFTTDLGKTQSTASQSSFEELMTSSSGEYAQRILQIKLTNASGTTIIYTFGSITSSILSGGAKLASCVIYKGQEGAVKADVTFVLMSNPTISS